MYVIEIREGSTSATRGEPPGGLVADFASTARDAGLRRGTIFVVGSRNGPTLNFSSDIPDELHQRFRNVLGIHRHRIKTPAR
jgi:hypothetical protein